MNGVIYWNNIVIIIIIIIAIVFITRLIIKHLNIKLNIRIIFGYLAALIALSFVCLILPGGVLVKSEKTSPVTDNSTASALLDRIKSSGDFSAPSGYKLTEKKFVPQGSFLKVMTENYDAEIDPLTKGVDLADNKDGMIDVYCYTLVNAKIGGTNLIIKNQIPTIEYYDSEGEVKIANKNQKAIGLYQFCDANSANQFIHSNDLISSPYAGSSIVVVVIPKNMRIPGTVTGFEN